jgi:hypothetical protein
VVFLWTLIPLLLLFAIVGGVAMYELSVLRSNRGKGSRVYRNADPNSFKKGGGT